MEFQFAFFVSSMVQKTMIYCLSWLIFEPLMLLTNITRFRAGRGEISLQVLG